MAIASLAERVLDEEGVVGIIVDEENCRERIFHEPRVRLRWFVNGNLSLQGAVKGLEWGRAVEGAGDQPSTASRHL